MELTKIKLLLTGLVTKPTSTKYRMEFDETHIWKELQASPKGQLKADWLGKAYSPQASIELRTQIAERLGMLAEEGWPMLRLLLNKYGTEPELIYATGICHQAEAKNYLIMLLQKDSLNLSILQALACWGTYLPNKTLRKILHEANQSIRLAGLELVKFKAHQLTDSELLELTKDMLDDFREPIVMSTIKILQRRDSLEICDAIAYIVENGSDKTAYSALMALGAIGKESSHQTLIKLSENLPLGNRRNLAKKQLKHQYRFSKFLKEY